MHFRRKGSLLRASETGVCVRSGRLHPRAGARGCQGRDPSTRRRRAALDTESQCARRNQSDVEGVHQRHLRTALQSSPSQREEPRQPGRIRGSMRDASTRNRAGRPDRMAQRKASRRYETGHDQPQHQRADCSRLRRSGRSNFEKQRSRSVERSRSNFDLVLTTSVDGALSLHGHRQTQGDHQ